MPTINQLALLDQVSGADQLAVYNTANGDARRLPINALLAYFEDEFASPTMATNLYTPGTGFNIAVPTPTAFQWMLLTPVGTLATGTITLPLNTSTPDGTEILVTTTQQITAFSMNANGAANLYGIPTTLGAEDFFRIRYVQSTNAWYRIA